MNQKTINGRIYSVQLVLFCSVLIVILKFCAYFYTNSFAILTDALESIINIVASGFTLYSLYYSSKNKDDDHPYGHGKIEFFAIGFEGALIMGTGLFIIATASYKLFFPSQIKNVDQGILFTFVGGLAMYLISHFLKSKGKQLNSAVLIADSKHFFVDTLTSAGLILGLIAYKLTDLIWIDAAIALLLGLHIIATGYSLIKESINNLLDKADLVAIDKMVVTLIKSRKNSWIDIHNLRLQKFGEHIHIDCHITLPYYWSLEQVHIEIKEIEKLLNNEHDSKIELFIHTDPCSDEWPCVSCNVSTCNFRKSLFVKQIDWNADNLMKNKKHRLDD